MNDVNMWSSEHERLLEGRRARAGDIHVEDGEPLAWSNNHIDAHIDRTRGTAVPSSESEDIYLRLCLVQPGGADRR